MESGLTVLVDLFAVAGPSPPWALQFAIIYPDDMYIRIYEHYRSLSRASGGGGRLQHLSYHYGPVSTERDEDGFPVKVDDCILRIDIDERSKRHAHYRGEDHIPEKRLIGLNFDVITPFDFIRAVVAHRKTTKPLHEIIGFEVAEKA